MSHVDMLLQVILVSLKDVKLRNLISKGPTYREQNNIDWRVNLKNCKAAVSRYAKKWAKEASVDRRVLRLLETGRKQYINVLMRRLDA